MVNNSARHLYVRNSKTVFQGQGSSAVTLAKTIRILSCLGKTAGLVLTVAGPFSGTPIDLTVFAVSSFLKDAVNRMGDLADDGKSNGSFKP